MSHSPFKESFVGYDIKALCRRRRLSKCIRNICTKNQEVLSRKNIIGNPGACLINTIGVCLMKDMGLSRAW
jgi:hypothetical protein